MYKNSGVWLPKYKIEFRNIMKLEYRKKKEEWLISFLHFDKYITEIYAAFDSFLENYY